MSAIMSDCTTPISTDAVAAYTEPDATMMVAPAVPSDAAAAQEGEPRTGDTALQEEEENSDAEQTAKAVFDNDVAQETALVHAAQDTPCALASVMTDAILPGHDLDQKNLSRWRACRCSHKPNVTAQQQQQKATAQQSGSALWPYVVVVLALAGALALAVWLDDPARVAGFATGNSAAGLVGVNATLDAACSPAPLINATTPTAISDIDKTDDDKDWCACLCQPKGPLLAGRIVDDQCVCRCLEPAQQPSSTMVYHSYAVCVATIVQMGSFLIAAIALGCILTF